MEGEDSDTLALSSCFICYICGDFFKRPRILPCGHTFCSECLAKLRDDIVNDGRLDIDHVSNADLIHTKVGNGVGKNPPTLSPEASADSNGTVNGVISKDSSNERKPSSSCVDDGDSTMNQSLTSSIGQWSSMSMSSSATYTCLRDKEKKLQRQVIPKNMSPRIKNETVCHSERCPSMVGSTSLTKSKQCSQCGSVVTSQRNSSTSPIKRSTSMTSTREQSSACARDLPRWDTSSPHRRSASHLQPPACSFDHKHGREMEPFVCPIPQCNYSMRVMNLARWSPKNKALANALAAWQQQSTSTQECGTQTDISNSQSVLVTIPRNLVIDSSASNLTHLPRRKRHSSMVDIAIDQAVSLDGPLQQPSYLPRGHYTWKSYAAMVGMNILQQVLNL